MVSVPTTVGTFVLAFFQIVPDFNPGGNGQDFFVQYLIFWPLKRGPSYFLNFSELMCLKI